jgi:hypothetical protein
MVCPVFMNQQVTYCDEDHFCATCLPPDYACDPMLGSAQCCGNLSCAIIGDAGYRCSL